MRNLIYVHGVKVRDEKQGIELGKPFRRWLNGKLAVNGADTGYEPVYWGNVAAHFRWELDASASLCMRSSGGSRRQHLHLRPAIDPPARGQEFFDDPRIKDLEGNLPCPSCQSHRPCPDAGQATAR